jgi:hypothetical protein
VNKIAIAFLSRDRVEQSNRSIEPLLRRSFDVFWIDGSKSEEGRAFPLNKQFAISPTYVRRYIYGGADAAICYALFCMLSDERQYTHVGLCEQDVLLHPDWFGPTITLFHRGQSEGLEVGAVSARSYADRILCQRDGYGLMHNLGSGHVIFTRQAAEIILRTYRTGHTWENRAVFAQLTNLDVARNWCFGPYYHAITCDWSWDAVLARHGLASLALVPNCATMLEDIAPMGLKYADAPQELLRDDIAFHKFVERTRLIREGKLVLQGYDAWFRDVLTGDLTIFAHQMLALGAKFEGKWNLRWSQGFGPFCWRAKEVGATLTFPAFGECHLIISGGQTHARLRAEAPGLDWETTIEPERPGRETVRLSLSGDFMNRTVRVTALTAGLCVFGLQTRAPQATDLSWRFDWSQLPPAE